MQGLQANRSVGDIWADLGLEEMDSDGSDQGTRGPDVASHGLGALLRALTFGVSEQPSSAGVGTQSGVDPSIGPRHKVGDELPKRCRKGWA